MVLLSSTILYYITLLYTILY